MIKPEMLSFISGKYGNHSGDSMWLGAPALNPITDTMPEFLARPGKRPLEDLINRPVLLPKPIGGPFDVPNIKEIAKKEISIVEQKIKTGEKFTDIGEKANPMKHNDFVNGNSRGNVPFELGVFPVAIVLLALFFLFYKK